MQNKSLWKILAISVALVLVASSVAMYSSSNVNVEKGISEGGGEGVISLVAPPFIEVAGASKAAGGGGLADGRAVRRGGAKCVHPRRDEHDPKL